MIKYRTGVSRRELLTRGLAASAALGLGAPTAARAALPALLAGTGGVVSSLLPTARDMYRDVKHMVDLGPRFTGSDAHNAFIDWLDEGFQSAGCQMLPRDEFAFTRWLVGDWGLECDGELAATGGLLFHYNPPYGDIYMEVAAAYQRRGFGSYLVQELKRICYDMTRIPAARCGQGNVASRRTLQRAGMLPCARIMRGRL